MNKAYRHLELDINGVLKFLLMKKKKYAATLISGDHTDKLVEKRSIMAWLSCLDQNGLATKSGMRIFDEIQEIHVDQQQRIVLYTARGDL